MKHVRIVFMALFIASSVTNTALAEEVVATVKGLVCSFCAQGIKKTFFKHPDVLDTKVDLESKLVTLTLKDGSTLSDNDIEQLVTDAGYAVEKIERRGGSTAPNGATRKSTPCDSSGRNCAPD